MNGLIFAEFSKLKIIQATYFSDYRKYFLAKLNSIFVVDANSFDNVKGSFPIGFLFGTQKYQIILLKQLLIFIMQMESLVDIKHF